MIFLIALAVFGSTLLGGAFALRLQDRLHLILGFSAGAVVAVAFFDLLPEAIELSARSPSEVFTFVGAGFLLYLVLDRALSLHSAAEEGRDRARGTARAGAFSAHSFLDGVGVGLAFQVSPAVGAIVAAAVLAHDFSDGINTVNVIIRHGGERAHALRWLLVDAAAPVLGIFVASFISIPDATLGILLALFSGFFLYIGASDLIPESHHAHPAFLTTAMTLFGALALFVAIKLAGV